ncbi:MAG: anaerobic glycerol-3-phosphate dehydrogenase subunit C [Bacteroidales bacterium]|nr:anaerobic glycerol-3-phosphate dehydrogenase subunit C [Bacteroidales bacterium]
MKMQEKNISENNFEQCIKCTVCTVYCPVVPVNPLYPGPKQAGPDGERLRLKKGLFFDDTLKYCLNCKRCEVACPSGVRIGDIIQAARIKHNTQPPKLRDMILASTDIMGSLATTVAPVVNFTLGLQPTKVVMDGVLKVDKHRTFPKYASQTFERWFRKNVQTFQDSFKRHVSMFHGCYVNYNYPQLGKDLVSVMNALGYGVHLLEKEKCCGTALISNGMIDQAKKNAKLNVENIRKSVNERQMPVIATSSSCTFTIRDEYPHLLGIENADVRDYMELATRFIYRLIDQNKVKLVFKKDYKAKVAYHTPCHMERLGWGIFSTELLKMIPGVELTILDSNCCGIAGTYGFKKENYEVSQAIGKPLFDQIGSINPDYVACDCETCKWQIEMSTGKTVKNPISVLAEALDLVATSEANK